MTLIYPSVVPPDDVRLPDALTVRYGPAPLLARFVLEGDKFVRQMGVRLRVRHDFGELVYANKRQVAQGTWFPLIDLFNPNCTDLVPENSFWLSGENDDGEIVLTWAARVYYWPDTSLREQAHLLFAGQAGQPAACRVTAPAASQISGVVFWGGSLWIHPDYRHRRLSRLAGRLGRAFAVSRWPLDWVITLVTPKIVESGVADGYGYRHLSHSVFYPGSPLGDLELVLVYLSATEAYEDFAEFLSAELAGAEYDGRSAAAAGRRLVQPPAKDGDEGFLRRGFPR